MFNDERFLAYTKSEAFKETTAHLYYEFLDNLKFIDSQVRMEEADFTAWDSSKHFDEPLYMKVKEAFYEKSKLWHELNFLQGMGLYLSETISRDDMGSAASKRLLAGAEHQKLLENANREMERVKKAPGADVSYIEEWSLRFLHRSDVYAAAFRRAGILAGKRQAEVIRKVMGK